MKQCTQCKQWKDDEEFSWQRQYLGQRKAKCKVCLRIEQKDYYEETKPERLEYKWNRQVSKREEARQFVYAYLSTHSCLDCRESDPLVLTFDHVRGVKRMDISQMVNQGYLIDAIKDEISKCEVVCANCHLRREKQRRGTVYK